MENKYRQANNESRKRLENLVDEITDKELRLVIYKEGWTIAAALGHLAFWDERRRVLLKLWQAKGVSPTQYIEDIVNDALIPVLLAVPPRQAAELAVATAEKLDQEIGELAPEMLKTIAALKEPMALDRAKHRNMHLDEIDALLKEKRGK